jgi:hypothetical protein
MLRQLFETSQAARKAATALSKAACVGVRFTDVPAEFRFYAVDGKPRFEPGKAKAPDFDLTLPPRAVRDICAKTSGDMGDLSILFLQHMFANEADRKVLVKVNSGLITLTLHGWLRVVLAACPKLIGWLAKMGLKSPSAMASALSRVKNGSAGELRTRSKSRT